MSSWLNRSRESCGSVAPTGTREGVARTNQNLKATGTLRVAHFSDTHLGYETYTAVAPDGQNQRTVDFTRAFNDAVSQIRDWDPPLVIHSGDLFDRPGVPTRHLLVAAEALAALAERRHDGTRRQVIVIAGNHDQPRARTDLAAAELWRNQPGVHVISGTEPQDLLLHSRLDGAHPDLDDVQVLAIPHDALRHPDLTALAVPDPDAQHRILVAHGVAHGSELFQRAIGREYPIPREVLTAGWDYGALGHWHRRGPVIAGPGDPVCFYAGSTERSGFGDLTDGGDRRGWLAVELHPGQAPKVTERDLDLRPMLRLPVLDARDLTAEEITVALIAHLEAATLDGAVVAQIVDGVRRDLWELVDLRAVRTAAAPCLHFQLMPRYQTIDATASTTVAGGPARVEELLAAAAADILPEERVDAAVDAAGRYLDRHRNDLSEPLPASSGGAEPADQAPGVLSPTGTEAA